MIYKYLSCLMQKYYITSHLKLQHQHKQLLSIITSKKVLSTINNILNLNHKISRFCYLRTKFENIKGKILKKFICCMKAYINDILNKLIFLTSRLMNQTSRTIYSSSSTRLFNELSFRLIWFMNQVQRVNYRIESQTIFELDRFIVSPICKGLSSNLRHPTFFWGIIVLRHPTYSP